MSSAVTLSRHLRVTPIQRSVLEFINDFIIEHGWAPTLDEIAAHRGVCKPTIHENLRALEHKGYLRRRPYTARAIELTGQCFAGPGELVSAGQPQPVSAQCLSCEAFVIAPGLQIGDWEPGADAQGQYVAREITIACPHCDQTSVHVQRRYGST